MYVIPVCVHRHDEVHIVVCIHARQGIDMSTDAYTQDAGCVACGDAGVAVCMAAGRALSVCVCMCVCTCALLCGAGGGRVRACVVVRVVYVEEAAWCMVCEAGMWSLLDVRRSVHMQSSGR